MINLNQIIKSYPQNVQGFKNNLLREYLQHLILSKFFNLPNGDKFTFIGGTAIRILRGSNRFSEDIDFDNKDIDFDDFEKLMLNLKEELEYEGLIIELRNVKRGAYHCYMKFPNLLFDNNLTSLKDQKILIQIDTHNQGVEYEPELVLINKFGITQKVKSAPLDILLAMKFNALLLRKRLKGRDLFDISYLLEFTQPNYDFLEKKIGIRNTSDLIHQVDERLKKEDIKHLIADVKDFLITQNDINKVEYFREILKKSLV